MFNRIRRNDKPIGEILIQRGIIDRFQLDSVLKKQKKENQATLSGDLMLKLGMVKEEDIVCAINYQYFVPYLPVNNYEVDFAVIELIPKGLAEKYCLIPLDKIQNSLTVAMANPLDIEAIREIMNITGCNVQAFISTSSEIRRAIHRYYGSNAKLFSSEF